MSQIWIEEKSNEKLSPINSGESCGPLRNTFLDMEHVHSLNDFIIKAVQN